LENRGRIFFWGVVAVAAVILLLRLEAPPLSDPDEARFARTSLEMLRNGDLVVPTFEGEPRLAKPPLLHWIQAALFQAFAPSGWVARLPSALATLGSLLLVAWVARRRFGEEGAAWAAAVFITIPLVFYLGRVGMTDALLALHVFAVIAIDMAGPKEGGPRKAGLIGALLGLAFMAKGPVGVLVPLIVILAGRTATRRDLLPSWRSALTSMVGWCIVVLPWGLVFMQRLSVGTAGSTLRTEVLERFFAGTAHVEPPWYYLAVVIVVFLPWFFPLVLGIGRVVALRKDPAARTALYAAAGFVAGLIFFSLSKGKLPHYIVPLAPLVALIVTWELGQELDAPRKRRVGPILLTVTLAGLAILLGAATFARDEGWARAAGVVGMVAYGLATAGGVAGVLRHRPRWVYGSAAAAAATFLVAVAAVVHPAVAAERSTKALIAEVPELRSGRPIVLMGIDLPSLVWYLDRPLPKIGPRRIAKTLDRDDRPLLIIPDPEIHLVPDEVRGRLEKLGRTGKLVVYQAAQPGR
jgi:4-amino-4-deoxy-L-arabinose transferase-like glycosyltransferase